MQIPSWVRSDLQPGKRVQVRWALSRLQAVCCQLQHTWGMEGHADSIALQQQAIPVSMTI